MAEKMGDLSKNIDIDKLISYSDDLVGVLKDNRDTNSLTQCFDNMKALRSSSDTDFNEVKSLLQDYENKIVECRLKTEATKSEVVADEELDLLNGELEEEIVINKEINDLECERISIQEQTQTLKKFEQDEHRAQRTLSMYASVTNIIPDLYDPSKVSGHIVNRNKKVVKKFEFDQTQMTAFDICDSIWKMIGA